MKTQHTRNKMIIYRYYIECSIFLHIVLTSSSSFPVEYKAATICLHLILSCAACCASPQIRLIVFSSEVSFPPGYFWTSLFPLSRWGPCQGYFMNVILVNFKGMSAPLEPPVFHFHHHIATVCVFVQGFTGY